MLGSKGRFYADGRFGDPLTLTVASIAHDASRVLPHSELASAMGGTVALREAEPQSMAERVARAELALWWREAGW